METLGKLFGSEAVVKLMRLFLLNRDLPMTLDDIASRARIAAHTARRELGTLERSGLIKRKIFSREALSRGKKVTKKVNGFVFDAAFPFTEQLHNLVVEAAIMHHADVQKRFKGMGKIKFFAVAGIFIRDPKSRLDIMLVGDRLNRTKIEKVIKTLEAEIGRELAYTILDADEFVYRLEMYDKLICDVLDFPHEKLIDLLRVGERVAGSKVR
jgi:DNA-binding Lrp family transcriptional regulator